MASREFIDSKGNEWRVWDVTPDAMHPRTKAEDYMQELADGWLVFETSDGFEKRRLSPYPADWAERTRAELEQLCDQATVVPRRRSSGSAAVQLADQLAASSEQFALRQGERRTFASPGGRLWQVFLYEKIAGTPVLRFTTEDLVLDLERWPDDWHSYDADKLALLLLDAHPAREGVSLIEEQQASEGEELQP